MKYQLRMLFWALMQLAGQYRSKRYGDPCSYLMEQMVLYQEEFLNMFVNAPDTCGNSYEMRLNGAGLKLLWMKYNGRLWMDIAGDQKDLYPEFVPRAEESLRMAGFKSTNDQNCTVITEQQIRYTYGETVLEKYGVCDLSSLILPNFLPEE